MLEKFVSIEKSLEGIKPILKKALWFAKSQRSVGRYKAILKKSFPDLKIKSFEYLNEGYSNIIFRVNQDYVFRFPKTSNAGFKMNVELNLLPRLKPDLKIEIPDYLLKAEAGKTDYPYSFGGYKFIQGIPFQQLSQKLSEEDWWQNQLGEFLKSLHEFPVAEAEQLGVKPIVFNGLKKSEPTWKANLEAFYNYCQQEIYPLLPEDSREVATSLFKKFLSNEDYFKFEPVLLHGDLTNTNILVDMEAQRITGIIDFNEMAIGDPAFDFYFGPLSGYSQSDASLNERIEFFDCVHAFEFVIFARNAKKFRKLGFNLNYLINYLQAKKGKIENDSISRA